MSVKGHLSQDLENNQIYFVTFTILGWKNIFLSKKFTDLIYKWFDYQKSNYSNKIHAYVIMPNHFHGIFYLSDRSPSIIKLIQNGKRFLAYQIIQLLEEQSGSTTGSPHSGDSLGAVDMKDSEVAQELLRFFASQAEVRTGAKYKVFEDGFDCKVIYNKDFLLEKLNYIHNNPLQDHWRLVKFPEEYINSSASNYLLGNGKYNIDVVELI